MMVRLTWWRCASVSAVLAVGAAVGCSTSDGGTASAGKGGKGGAAGGGRAGSGGAGSAGSSALGGFSGSGGDTGGFGGGGTAGSSAGGSGGSVAGAGGGSGGLAGSDAGVAGAVDAGLTVDAAGGSSDPDASVSRVPLEQNGWVVLYNPGNGADPNNALFQKFQIYRVGSAGSLAGAKLRYYFTKDEAVFSSAATGQSFWYGGKQIGVPDAAPYAATSSIKTLTPATATADSYVEIAFDSVSAPTLDPGAGSGIGVDHTLEATTGRFTQSNDYSFYNSGNEAVSNTHIVLVDKDGKVVWGTPPS